MVPRGSSARLEQCQRAFYAGVGLQAFSLTDRRLYRQHPAFLPLAGKNRGVPPAFADLRLHPH